MSNDSTSVISSAMALAWKEYGQPRYMFLFVTMVSCCDKIEFKPSGNHIAIYLAKSVDNFCCLFFRAVVLMVVDDRETNIFDQGKLVSCLALIYVSDLYLVVQNKYIRSSNIIIV